jgi:putative ATP-dependent endonuclease of the OLD family
LKLTQLTLCNFQSFGPTPTVITFESMTFLIGPNGAGKTAVLQALARLFAFDPSLRRVRKTDFHIMRSDPTEPPAPIDLWLEAQFEFAELKEGTKNHPTIPGHFAHLQLESSDSVPRVRLRLEAHLDEDGDIDEQLFYVVQVDEHGLPLRKVPAARHDRNQIQVHYLPARRDPTDHISYAATSLMGRALRAADWRTEQEEIAELTRAISEALVANPAIASITAQLTNFWSALHKSSWYANPGVSFGRGELDNLLRHLTVGFEPGPDGAIADFSRLSDGQKSLLYLSVVLALQAIGRKVLANELDAFSIDRLRPPVFTFIAMEEPENSLAPHYLGRVIKTIAEFSKGSDAQAIVATHAPSLLKRVAPERIRYLRLSAERTTMIRTIVMPEATDEAHKFVREAVQAFPELYFSRLVILGEGDSEEIVLPRLLEARGLGADDTSICVVPLGGRHVNHLWRLLHGLGIPQVTLLDLDLARYQGGWGRLKYAIEQLLKFPTITSTLKPSDLEDFPKWDDATSPLDSQNGKEWLEFLELAGVFFSSPLDLDFAMLRTYTAAYGIKDADLQVPDERSLIAVLGKSHGEEGQYAADQQKYFDAYHRLFKLGSKPAAHLTALAKLDGFALQLDMPAVFGRMLDRVKKMLADLPE